MLTLSLVALLLSDVGITNSATGAGVNSNGQLSVTTARDGGTLSEFRIVGDNGTFGYITQGNRLAVTPVSPMWDDTFNSTAQNTAKYRAPATTQTVTYTGGYVTLNGSAIVTANTNSAYQTYRTFALYSKSELRVNFSALLTQVPQVNNVIEFGLFTATLPGAAAPADGCFFRYNAAAELRGVCSYNTTETQTAAITAPSASVNHDYVIAVQTNTVKFVIDDAVVGTLTLLTDAPSEGQPMAQGAVPVTMRTYIGATPPALATQFRVSDIFVTQLGGFPNRPWNVAKAGYGHMSSQGQNGGTMGSTALYTNNLAPGAGVAPTNTTAALGSGLGGQFAIQPTLTASTDGIISSFQNPVGSVTQTPRNLVITGVKIDGIVTTAFTGGPVYYLWSLAYGHTAVSLATAEAATTKAARRVPLGIQTYVVTAPVGTLGQTVQVTFQSPIVVAPGEFVQLVAKNVGTVTSAGVITTISSFDGYWE